MIINDKIIQALHKQALDSPRLRANLCLHQSTSDKVQKMINGCVYRLISEDVKAGEYTMEAMGDTAVYAFKYEDCMDIIVTQDYYNDTLFEDEYDPIRKED